MRRREAEGGEIADHTERAPSIHLEKSDEKQRTSHPRLQLIQVWSRPSSKLKQSRPFPRNELGVAHTMLRSSRHRAFYRAQKKLIIDSPRYGMQIILIKTDD